MKRVKFNVRHVVIITVSLVFFACSKAEDGAIGPAGPMGQTGPPGQTGPSGQNGVDGLNGGADGVDGQDGQDGTDGQDGEIGTANVIYSPLITIAEADWDVSSGGRIWFAQIDEPKLTQDIFEKGVVLVYSYSAADGGVYSLMPDGTFTNWVRVNAIGIRRVQENSPYLPVSERRFRYILIPGGISTTAKTALDFKKMTFEEVMVHFRLEY